MGMGRSRLAGPRITYVWALGVPRMHVLMYYIPCMRMSVDAGIHGKTVYGDEEHSYTLPPPTSIYLYF
jgi:hypothetical protein